MTSVPQKCDVLLITVTETETRSVLEAAKRVTGKEAKKLYGKEKTYFFLGNVGGASVFLVRSEMGAIGVGGATVTTRDALSEVNPGAVIMVGIAFGVDPRKQKIGLVLVSQQIQAYDLQRVGTDKSTGAPTITLRGDRVTASPRLLDRLRTASLTWGEDLVKFGLILSGQKLIDNIDYRDQLRNLVSEAIGGEMEGAGVYAAAGYNQDWIIVKAISDWADGNKKRNKEARQRQAANSAAHFVLHAIKDGGLLKGQPNSGKHGLSEEPTRTNHKMPKRSGPSRVPTDAGQAPAEQKSSAGTGPVLIVGRPADSNIADLWTPGLTKKRFIANYSQIVGPDHAALLWSYSRKAIRAVEEGDFAMKLKIGQAVYVEADMGSPLSAMGHYLAGEGNRLLADLEINRDRQSDLLRQAAFDYQEAFAMFPGDPRPLRGLGRLLETKGDIGQALPLLEEAKALALFRFSQLSSSDRQIRPDAIHEVLRTTRHLIHCLLEIRRTNRLSEWNREHKNQQLIGYIVECENLHRELMPHFQSQERWWLIEWFMALVFLARAWGAVGERERMTRSLLHALNTKRKSMLGSVLSPVDRINIQWWLDVAFSAPAGPDPLIIPRLDSIRSALTSFNDGEVIRQMDVLLLPYLPPWDTSFALSALS